MANKKVTVVSTEAENDSGPSEFGRWLNQTRASQKLSVTDLADKSGVSFVQIYNIENGTSQNPQSKTIKKLADALGTKPDASVIQATETAASVENVGEFIDFDPHDKSAWPSEPGVYVFYDVSDRPVYVGQGQKIKSRLASHETRFWFKAPIVERASYVKIEDEKLRVKIEKVLIKFLKSNAVLNKQNVDCD
jgi:transcriptional regulator with XRE-family HTH domain